MTSLDLPVWPLAPLLELHLGARLQGATRLHGGDISDTFRLRTTRGDFVLKTTRLILPVPDVVAHGSGPGGHAYLLLSWLPPGQDTPGAQDTLGRGLAALHARPAPGFGGTPDNYFGRLPQRNPTARSAADVYWTARLRPLLDCAAPLLNARDQGRFETLGERLSGLIPASPPALVHGDLWHGNVRYTGRGPALLDPAATFSHREVDIAALNLFGRVPQRVFDAYGEVLPLSEGWEARVALWNLYPLLAHVVMFGGGYLARTRAALEAALALPEL